MSKFVRREVNFLQVVAILGAHSLGNAEVRNSGHRGSWTPLEENVFNVTYFQNMATKDIKWINKVRPFSSVCTLVKSCFYSNTCAKIF